MRKEDSPPAVLPVDKAFTFGQVLVTAIGGSRFRLCHRDDADDANTLDKFEDPEAALQIARTDDAGNYRPLKTAPNLRHGWQLEIGTFDLWRALDYFYPGRLALLQAWKERRLKPTPMRDTLGRQSGMYRVAATISDQELNDVIGNFCRSDGGCLRTILWKRDARGAVTSTKLPPEKFDPAYDQSGRGENAIPLLCQEICSLLLNECRKAVKGEINE